MKQKNVICFVEKSIEEAAPPDSIVNCKSALRVELKMLMLFPLHNV